jgi:hypothetical protein
MRQNLNQIAPIAITVATKSNRANLKSVEDNTKEKQSKNETLTDKWRAGKFSQASSFAG